MSATKLRKSRKKLKPSTASAFSCCPTCGRMVAPETWLAYQPPPIRSETLQGRIVWIWKQLAAIFE